MKYVLVGLSCVVLGLLFFFANTYYKGQQVEKYGFMAEKKR